MSSESEESLEGCAGLPPTVVSKHKLVEVGRKLPAADPVVGAYEPTLQVADGSVDDGYDGLCALPQMEGSGLHV